MTITIHSPKCKYCHLILLLEKILRRGMYFSLDGHLLLVSSIEEREREREARRKGEKEGKGMKGREGKGRKGRGKEGRGESILFCCLLAYPLRS